LGSDLALLYIQFREKPRIEPFYCRVEAEKL